MSRSISVIHLDGGREDRGGQRQVALLLQGLVERGHRVALATPEGAPLSRRVARVQVTDRWQWPWRGDMAPRAAFELARRIRRGGWDLLHAHTPHAITLAHVARRLAGWLPLIAHRRVDFPLKQHVLARRKAVWPEAWIAVSEGVKEQLVADGLSAENIQVVPSAIDPVRLEYQEDRRAIRRALSIAEDDLVIGTVGYLVPHKGQRVLIDAWSSLPSNGRVIHLVIVGKGPLRETLEEQVRRSGSEAGGGKRCHFLGQRDDVADLVRAFDVFAFPSVSGEGSPAALKEPMALGVPVVASDIPAHRNLGLDSSLLVEPCQAEALCERIRWVLNMSKERSEMLEKNHALAARYSVETMIEQTISCYRSLLDDKAVVR